MKESLPAGSFSSWLHDTRVGLTGGAGSEVPCGDCNACCRSSYFIHVGPDEAQSLAAIPAEILFDAPGRPKGTVLMGYDQDGRCPMLRDGVCSIYADRPATCRIYDCRVFAATGVTPDRSEIASRVGRWAFSFPSQEDRDESRAVQAAARFLEEHADCLPPGSAPGSASQIALLALKTYGVFLARGGGCEEDRPKRSHAEVAEAILEAAAEFERGGGAGAPTAPRMRASSRVVPRRASRGGSYHAAKFSASAYEGCTPSAPCRSSAVSPDRIATVAA